MKFKKPLKETAYNQADNTAGFDLKPAPLLKEIYLALKQADLNSLAPEVVKWVDKMDGFYSEKVTPGSELLYSVLEQSLQVLDKKDKWIDEDENLYEMFEKLIFLELKNNRHKDFFENVEEVINSLVQLDFSKKAVPPGNNSRTYQMLNYVAFSLNMIVEKMKTSVVSMKAVNCMSSAPSGSAVLVTDNTGEIRFMNRIGESLLRIDQNAFLGHSANKLFKEFDEIINQLNSSEEINIKAHLFLEEGNIPILLKVLRAGAEEEEIKELVFIIQKREKTDKKTDEVFNITQESHDKLAPLNSILGVTQLIKRKLIDEESKYLMSFLENMIARLKEKAQKSLLYISLGKQEIKTEIVNVEFIIDSVIESLQFVPGADEITFTKEIKYKSDLCTNSELLYSIIQNLVSNAIKYRKIGEKNKVLITVSDSPDDKLLIRIEDTGIGISEENQKKVFENNFRAQFSTEDTIEGNGVGLFLVKESVSILNGEIEVQSKLHAGTVFLITLPYTL